MAGLLTNFCLAHVRLVAISNVRLGYGFRVYTISIIFVSLSP